MVELSTLIVVACLLSFALALGLGFEAGAARAKAHVLREIERRGGTR